MKRKEAVLVAERCSEVTRMEVGSELPVSVFVMVRPYSGHPISKASAKALCTLVIKVWDRTQVGRKRSILHMDPSEGSV